MSAREARLKPELERLPAGSPPSGGARAEDSALKAVLQQDAAQQIRLALNAFGSRFKTNFSRGHHGAADHGTDVHDKMTTPCIETSSGWPFVKSMVCYDVVDSTSDRAAALVRDGCTELPLAVRARHQTRGRGRGDHTWWSDTGSLTLTLAIDPAHHGLRRESEPRLALATAVAVIAALDTLELGTPALGIRWPNDLEAAGRKLGGILPECLDTPDGRRILIGIGLNGHTDLKVAPAEVRVMANSIALMSGKHLDEPALVTLVREICEQFAIVLTQLAGDDESLCRRWADLDLLRDRWVEVDQGRSRLFRVGAGELTVKAALCLDDGHGERRLFGGQVLRQGTDRS